jgi:pheromone alpha factor receptor
MAAPTVTAMASFTSPGFDPFHQTMTMYTAEGSAIPVSLDSLNEYALYEAQESIVASTQLGASGIVLVILLILTRADRRATAVFGLNVLSLILNVLRCLFQILYFTSAWWNVYAQYSGDASRVTQSDYAVTRAGEFMQLLLTISVCASLVYQVAVVTKTFTPVWRRATLAMAAVLVLSTVATMTVTAAYTIESIDSPTNDSDGLVYQRIAVWSTASHATLTATIGSFSLVFLSKLLLSIRTRRTTLGFRGLGNIEVLAIGACQCMVIPSPSPSC